MRDEKWWWQALKAVASVPVFLVELLAFIAVVVWIPMKLLGPGIYLCLYFAAIVALEPPPVPWTRVNATPLGLAHGLASLQRAS